MRVSQTSTVSLGTLASDPAGLPVALWQERLVIDGETTHWYHVRRRGTAGWTALGTSLVASGAVNMSGLAVAPDGTPIIAVHQRTDVGGGASQSYLHVYRLNGEP